MSHPKEPEKAFLFVSIMLKKDNLGLFNNILDLLKKKLGNIIYESDFFNFNFTIFYEKEFGQYLIKKYFVFDIFDIELLSEYKLFCYEIENMFLKNRNRLFNIDVGYITKNSFVLATFKERAHRIYINKGVYADLQLVFENNEWKEFKWTFPDIKANKEFFEKVKKGLNNLNIK